MQINSLHLYMYVQEGLEQAWASVKPPPEVECCPIGFGQDWVAFNLCHMSSDWMGGDTTGNNVGVSPSADAGRGNKRLSA
jgi:hypothetical protein